MKNKKIILGLGTITALGAMSMGFVACVKKGDLDGYVKKDQVFNVYETTKLEKAINKAFAEKGTGTNKTNPKALGQLNKGSKVSDLIANVQEKDEFKNGKFKIISNAADKEGNTDNGKALSGTSHKLTFTWATEPDNTEIKVEVEFTFTIKATA